MSFSKHTVVATPKAPGSNPALSQATVYNGLVYCSGSLGMNPETNTFVEGTIGDRTTQALLNLKVVLEEAGSSTDKVLKVLVFVTDMKEVPAMNEAYMAFFAEPRPARSCVAVKELPRGADVEIECVGYI